MTLAAVLWIQHCPLIYFAYAGFPVFFWEEVLANRETLKKGLKVLMQGDGKQISPMTIASQSILYIAILESLVSLISYSRIHLLIILGVWIFSQTYF